MLLSSKGIVLQSIKYGDSSLISKVFSEEKGLISIISNRSKSKKNRTVNYLQPLSPIHFVCYLSNKSNIHRLKEISFDKESVFGNENVAVSAIRFFLAEFLCVVVKEEEQNQSLFSFLHKKVLDLSCCSQTALSDFHICFLIDFLDLLGIYPNLNIEHSFLDLQEGITTSNKPQHVNYYKKEDFSLLLNYTEQRANLNKTQKKALLALLMDYYILQLGGEMKAMKSREVLEVVFN